MEVEEALLLVVEGTDFDTTIGVDAKLDEAARVSHLRDDDPAFAKGNETAVEEKIRVWREE